MLDERGDQLRQEIGSGFFKIVAHTQLAGQPVLELQHKFPSPPGSSPWTRDLWVSAQTDLPIRSVSSSTEGARRRATRATSPPPSAAALAHLKPVVPPSSTRTATPPTPTAERRPALISPTPAPSATRAP